MLNLLRMNFYRLVKTTAMWKILIAMCICSIAFSYMEKVDFDLAREEAANSDGQVEEADELYLGIYVETPTKGTNGFPSFMEFYNVDVTSGIIFLFVSIATALFVNGEEKFGFIKNIAGQTKHKSMIYLAKMIVLFCYNVLLFVCYGLVQYVSLSIFFRGEDMPFGMEYLKEELLLLGVCMVLYAGFLSGISFLTTVFRSATVGVTIGVMNALGTGLLIAEGLEKVFDIELAKYFILQNAGKMILGVSPEKIRFAVAMGIFWLVVYNVLGTFCFTRRDTV